MSLLDTKLAMIHHFLIKKGFLAVVFDRTNLNHQHIRRPKSQWVKVATGVTRLGGVVQVD